MRLRLAIACVALWSSFASAKTQLQPSSQWGVDYAADSCRLIRTFGDGGNETKLVLESRAPGEMTMVVSGKPLAVPVTTVNVGARFLPQQEKPFFGRPAFMVNQTPAVMWNSVPLTADFEFDNRQVPGSLLMVTRWPAQKPYQRPAALDQAKAQADRTARDIFLARVTEIEIKAPGQPAVLLETGSLADPMKVFDQCDRDLITDLGLDASVQDKVVKKPWPSRPWIDPKSYPLPRLMRGEEASVVVRALVDAAGKVTSCTASSNYDAPDFKKAVCDSLVNNAKFEPAELADGTKVASYYVTSVSFRTAD